MSQPQSITFSYSELYKNFVEAGGYFGTFISGLRSGLQGAIVQGEIKWAEAAKEFGDGFRRYAEMMVNYADSASAANNPQDAAVFNQWAKWASDKATIFQNDGIAAREKFDVFAREMNGHISSLGTVGKYAGPAFDAAAVISAIAGADGNKAGEAVIQMGLGMLGGIAGLGLAAILSLGGIPAAFLAAGMGVLFTLNAGWINEYVARPLLDSLGELIPDGVWRLFTSAQRATPRRDPLTFDLDGDGLETVGTATSSVYFDHDADGVKTRTGWVAADDGLLVLDRNGNGTIDNGTELFGDATPMSAAAGGGRARDGFVALRQQDTNSDGVVNANDANWANLRIWQDANQDGISQAAELRTLASLNISGINVTPTSNSQVLPDGNRIADLGTFTRMKLSRKSGSTGIVCDVGDVGQMADIDLQQNTFDSRFTDSIALTDAAKDLALVAMDLVIYTNNTAQYPCALPGRNAW
jgi:hypothetical protein